MTACLVSLLGVLFASLRRSVAWTLNHICACLFVPQSVGHAYTCSQLFEAIPKKKSLILKKSCGWSNVAIFFPTRGEIHAKILWRFVDIYATFSSSFFPCSSFLYATLFSHIHIWCIQILSSVIWNAYTFTTYEKYNSLSYGTGPNDCSLVAATSLVPRWSKAGRCGVWDGYGGVVVLVHMIEKQGGREVHSATTHV